MPDVFDLTEQYRDQLMKREDKARLSMLKEYRSVWSGLDKKIESTAKRIEFSEGETADLAEAFKDEMAAAVGTDKPAELSVDKLGKFTDLLLRKNSWQELERSLDGDFRSVADRTAEVTEEHRKALGQTAVDHAVKLMQAQLGKDKTQRLPKEALEALNKKVKADVEEMWQKQRDDLREIFRAKAAEVSQRAREALRQEVLHGLLINAGAKQILDRVKQAIDDRKAHPEKDPVLVRALQSEYRIATQNSYRESMRMAFTESGRVSGWRWTSARTPATCAVCWAMDGKIFPLETPLKSHPHCRCVPVPVVEKSAENALFAEAQPGNENEPGGREGGETGVTAFSNIPPSQQKAILGARAFDAYERGEFDLSDLVGVQFNTRFGVTLYRQSVDRALWIGSDPNKKPAENLLIQASLAGGGSVQPFNTSGMFSGGLPKTGKFQSATTLRYSAMPQMLRVSDSNFFLDVDDDEEELPEGMTALNFAGSGGSGGGGGGGGATLTSPDVTKNIPVDINSIASREKITKREIGEAILRYFGIETQRETVRQELIKAGKLSESESLESYFDRNITGDETQPPAQGKKGGAYIPINFVGDSWGLWTSIAALVGKYKFVKGKKNKPVRMKNPNWKEPLPAEDGSGGGKKDTGGGGGNKDGGGPSPVPGMNREQFEQLLKENPYLIPIPKELIDRRQYEEMMKLLEQGQIPKPMTPLDPAQAEELNRVRELIRKDIQDVIDKVKTSNGDYPLYDAFANLRREDFVKRAIEARFRESGIDLRNQNANEYERAFNNAFDSMEKDFRDDLDSDKWGWSDLLNPTTIPFKMGIRYLAPDWVKDEIVNFQMGMVKGTIGLASVLNGIGRFYPDLVTDAFLGLAKWSGADVSGLESAIQKDRDRSKAFWRAATGAQTKTMARQDLAYKAITDLGIRTVPYDAPNWSSKAGELTVRALPYLALTVATGGSAAPVIVWAGLDAGGQTYSVTQDRWEAGKAAAINAAATAVGGLAGHYGGVAGGKIFNAALQYTTLVAHGETDPNKIFQEMLLNSALDFATEPLVKSAISRRTGRTNMTDLEYQKVAFDDLKQSVAEGSVYNTRETLNQIEVDTVRQVTESQSEIFNKSGKTANVNDIPLTLSGKKVSVRTRAGISEIYESWGAGNQKVTKTDAVKARTSLRENLGKLTKPGQQMRLNGDGTLAIDDVRLPQIDVENVRAAYDNVREIAKFHLEALQLRSRVSLRNFASLMQAELGRKYALTGDTITKLYNMTANEMGIDVKGTPRPFKVEKLKQNPDDFKDLSKDNFFTDAVQPNPNEPQQQKPKNQKPQKPQKPDPADEKLLKTVRKQVEKLIGKNFDPNLLPEGYHHYETDAGPVIRRNRGNKEMEFPALTIKDNKFAYLVEGRLSNANRMVKNFNEALAAVFENSGKNFGGEKMSEWISKTVKENFQIHHLLPDSLIKNELLGELAIKAGYILDRGTNLIGLVKKPELIGNAALREKVGDTNLFETETGHFGDHKEYSALVKQKMKDVELGLRQEFSRELKRPEIKGDLFKLINQSEAARQNLLLKMKGLEDYFRDLIKSGNAPTKNKRLSFLQTAPGQESDRA